MSTSPKFDLDEYYSRPPTEIYGADWEADLAGSVPLPTSTAVRQAGQRYAELT
jgi:hypothetical protein